MYNVHIMTYASLKCLLSFDKFTIITMLPPSIVSNGYNLAPYFTEKIEAMRQSPSLNL